MKSVVSQKGWPLASCNLWKPPSFLPCGFFLPCGIGRVVVLLTPQQAPWGTLTFYRQCSLPSLGELMCFPSTLNKKREGGWCSCFCFCNVKFVNSAQLTDCLCVDALVPLIAFAACKHLCMCACVSVCACMFLGKDRQQQIWANETGLPDHDPKPRDSGGRRLGPGSTLSTLNHSHGFQIYIYDEMEAKMRLQVKSRPLYHPWLKMTAKCCPRMWDTGRRMQLVVVVIVIVLLILVLGFLGGGVVVVFLKISCF